MSYTIATALTINKDFTQFKIKGGCNNLIPRSNEWGPWWDINLLLRELVGGGTQFGIHNQTMNEKFLRVNHLVSKFNKEWGGGWDEKNTLWHSLGEEVQTDKVKEFNDRFISELKEILKGHTKRDYVVTEKHFINYVTRVKGGRAYMSGDINRAKRFGKYQARQITKQYSSTVSAKVE